MLRRLAARLMGAEPGPIVAWSDMDAMTVEARVTVELPRLWGRTETLEQVLCSSTDGYALFNRRGSSGRLSCARFGRQLNGREMRLTEREPGTSVYRLRISPQDVDTVTYMIACPTWFGLWKNEGPMSLGAGICYLDGPDRDALVELRARLLGGTIPEALANEEAMWSRTSAMGESERRAAYAALAMRSMAEVDRRFEEQNPGLGPMPDALKAAFGMVEARKRDLEQTAASAPVDAELGELMTRFVDDATRRGSGPDDPKESRDRS